MMRSWVVVLLPALAGCASGAAARPAIDLRREVYETVPSLETLLDAADDDTARDAREFFGCPGDPLSTRLSVECGSIDDPIPDPMDDLVFLLWCRDENCPKQWVPPPLPENWSGSSFVWPFRRERHRCDYAGSLRK